MTATGVPPHLVLANQIVDMQKGMDVLRAEVISMLDGLPEALKQKINGIVLITHLQEVEMVEKPLSKRPSRLRLFRTRTH